MTNRSRSLIVTPLLTVGALGLLALSAVTALAAAPEKPETKPATAITATTATLNGVLNPKVEAVTGYEFTYNTNGTCTEGSTTEPGAEAKVKAGKVSTPLTGLEPNREYTFCVVATHLEGETTESTSGLPVTFKTLTAKPAVGIESASGVTPFEATLNAEVNPNNQGTPYSFQYSTKATGEKLEGSVTTVKGASPLSGFGVQSASVPTGAVLTPATTYHYRVLATNATGTTEGKVAEVTTPALEQPLIDGESAPTVTQTDAQLHALINPNYQTTTYQFKLGTDTSYALAAVPVTPGELAAGFGDSEVSVDLHAEGVELKPNTEYHYEAVATNATGSTEGLIALGDQTFLTLPNPPTVSTGGASSITTNSATISGTVNPGASEHSAQDDTTYHFQYGNTTSYGAQVPFPSGEAGEGTSPVPETASLTGLEPGSTYHYRIVASNDNTGTPQTTYGEDETFTTVSTPPILSGISVSGVTQSTATITATLEPQGLPTRYELQLGSTQGLLQAQAFGNAAGAGVVPLTLTVGSLSPGTLYYYKLIATNLNGTVEPEGAFTTAAGPGAASSPLTQPPTPPLLATPTIAFPSEPTAGAPVKKGKPLTNAQKLANALRACRKKPKTQRAGCERQVRRRYRAGTKGTPKKK